MEEVLEFLKNNMPFYVATIDGKQARVRPFGAVTAIDGKLYFVTSNKKEVYKQLQTDPQIEICTTDPEKKWLRVEASAVFDMNREAKIKMLENVPTLQSKYAVDDGKMEVFYLKDATAVFSSFTGEPKRITF
ncbi:MAG: pyridoxamine 5'-phosphate oxidase family protein [Clostridiales bacterium]|nr:pyridoxamine 5'-phosphate oxidase family protein [Clostridiales bacterium]